LGFSCGKVSEFAPAGFCYNSPQETSPMSDYTSLLSAASQLSVADRLRLIDELTETLPELPDDGLSPEWRAEIERRSREIDAGTAQLEDWESVRARLFQRANLSRET
jgi:putative addiction module component (TIGR02574 family)